MNDAFKAFMLLVSIEDRFRAMRALVLWTPLLMSVIVPIAGPVVD